MEKLSVETEANRMNKRKNNSQTDSKPTRTETREILLQRLNETMEKFYELYRDRIDLEIEIYEGWNARDILGHITFWHESFARNVNALIKGNKPSPLKGKYVEINQRSIDETKTLTTKQIMSRLKNAHRIIHENILSDKLEMIPYRKGSRDYSPEEHLDIVNGHIAGHLKSIEKVQRARQKKTI
jgi:hypothetical protein